jgi:hypothetical protein
MTQLATHHPKREQSQTKVSTTLTYAKHTLTKELSFMAQLLTTMRNLVEDTMTGLEWTSNFQFAIALKMEVALLLFPFLSGSHSSLILILDLLGTPSPHGIKTL